MRLSVGADIQKRRGCLTVGGIVALCFFLAGCDGVSERMLNKVFGHLLDLADGPGDHVSIRHVDSDGDGWLDAYDNCPVVVNPDQANHDGDALGDACDPDDDNDGLPDGWEEEYGMNPADSSDVELDDDGDGLTNLQEYRRGTRPDMADTDSDGAGDRLDNCPRNFNADQGDLDGDGDGDVCDEDADGDGVSNGDELFAGSDPHDDSDIILDPYTFRVSTAVSGEQANEFSHSPTITAAGNRVAFASQASNLGPDDGNGFLDIYVADLDAHTSVLTNMQRVSLAYPLAESRETDDDSITPRISADGRWLAYSSLATTIVEADTNGWQDIFLTELDGGATRRVNVSASGAEAWRWGAELSDLSADGRWLAFNTNERYLVPDDTNMSYDVFLYDAQENTLGRTISAVHTARVTADGQVLVVESPDDRLTSPDSNEARDIYLYYVASQGVERITLSPLGEESDDYSYNPDITADGRYVVYQSRATNLVAGDSNDKQDIFVYDRETQTTERVSVSSAGEQGNGDSIAPTISDDGRFVVFESAASNLVPLDLNGKKDIFLHDRRLGLTRLVSVSSAGTQGNGDSNQAIIAGDGQRVAFVSEASNLVEGDTNKARDIFVRDLGFARAPGD